MYSTKTVLMNDVLFRYMAILIIKLVQIAMFRYNNVCVRVRARARMRVHTCMCFRGCP